MRAATERGKWQCTYRGKRPSVCIDEERVGQIRGVQENTDPLCLVKSRPRIPTWTRPRGSPDPLDSTTVIPLTCTMFRALSMMSFSQLPCETDTDCSLNGVCTGPSGRQRCVCDSPWKDATTEACSVLDVLPHPDDYVPAYGGPRTDTAFHDQNLTSWGGNIVLGDDGKYHLFVSAMDGGGGLNVWGHGANANGAIHRSQINRCSVTVADLLCRRR